MIRPVKEFVKQFWPALRLRTILLGVLLFAAAMPLIGAAYLRVYENTLVRQTEAELVAQGAALAAVAAVEWPGAPPSRPRPARPSAGYFQPEFASVDLIHDPILPERPVARPASRPFDPAAKQAALDIGPIVERTLRTTLASAVLTDRSGVAVAGVGSGGDFSTLPEVKSALAGQPATVLRVNGDYQPRYAFEWLSRAARIRLHHARPIIVGGEVRGVLLLSRSPRAMFRGIYEDRVQYLMAGTVILGALIVLSGLISRGVTRPIEQLSAVSRTVATGDGEVPDTPRTAAVEIRALYEDFRVMAARIERRSAYLRDFAAAVSHEFKTPLAGITGAVELLQDHFDAMSATERRRFLDNIAGDSARLSRLVTRLLDLARADMASPEAGVSTDLSAAVRQAAEGERRAGFEVRVDLTEPPRVAAPATTIESVVTILLQNARQAGASAANISAVWTDAEVTLIVSDNGPGVPVGDRERMFEPFFTSRRAEGGTGLGLSIAWSLLSASQGRIELAATRRGAAFQVSLPRADSI